MSCNSISDSTQISTSTAVQTQSEMKKNNEKSTRKKERIYGGCDATVTKNSHNIIGCLDCVIANKERIKCNIENCRCKGEGFLFKVGNKSENKKFAHQVPSERHSARIHIGRPKQTQERIANASLRSSISATEAFSSSTSSGKCVEIDSSSDEDIEEKKDYIDIGSVTEEVKESNSSNDDKCKLPLVSFEAGEAVGDSTDLGFDGDFGNILKDFDESCDIPKDLADQQIV